MKKPKDKRRTRDLYYRRKYGITLAEYEERKAEHGGGCEVCGRVPLDGEPALAVDHDHAVARLKHATEKLPDGHWYASIPDRPEIDAVQRTKRAAIGVARKRLLALSWRGNVCPACNRGLGCMRWFRNDPEIIQGAANYLRAYANKLKNNS